MNMEQTYKNFIENIINNRGKNGCEGKYFERHHITPKCLGGSNDEENLISLYAEEHFLAHKLLAQENPDNEKLVNAYAMMAFVKNNYQDRIEISPEEFASAREAFSESMKKKWKDEEYRNIQSNNLKKRWENPEYRKTQSERRTKLNNRMWSDPEFKRKMGSKTKERWENASQELLDKSKELMRNISNKLWENPEYIKQHCSPVYCIETDEYFFKQQDACIRYNINSSSISNYLKGRQKSAGKHPITGEKLHWKSISWETYYENNPDIHQSNEINLLGSNES